MKRISCKENAEKLAEIREELTNGRPVEVHNQYETFYGHGFDGWLRKGIADIACDIKVTSVNHFADCGYPWAYVITPNTNNK